MISSFWFPSRLSINHWRKVNKSIWYIQTTRKHSLMLITAYCCGNSTKMVFEENCLIVILKSYLTNSKQRVRVNSHYSDYVNVTTGVPQGSILSSLPFLIYNQDLPGNCHNFIPLLNADDAKLLHIGAPGLKFQLDLSRNTKWSEIQKLYSNLDKCSHMSIPPEDNLLYVQVNKLKGNRFRKILV